MIVDYTTILSDGTWITTQCSYDPATGRAYDFDDVDPDVLDDLIDEFISLPDGTDLRESEGVFFDY